jgi:hypothetical protein
VDYEFQDLGEHPGHATEQPGKINKANHYNGFTSVCF